MPLHLGDYSYANGNKYRLPLGGDVWVGKYTSIAYACTFLAGWGAQHRSVVNRNYVANFNFEPVDDPGTIHIGSDVWVGTESMLMPGVTIGDGAIIGARSLVTHDVPPYAVVAGHPARILRHRFPAELIAALLRIRWWDWPRGEIEASWSLMHDVYRFVAQHDPGHARDHHGLHRGPDDPGGAD